MGKTIKFVIVIIMLLAGHIPADANGRRPPWEHVEVNTVVDGKIKNGVNAFVVDKSKMISLRTVRGVFGGRVEWKRVSRRIVYLSEGNSVEFGLDLSTAVISGKTLPLSPPVRAWGNDVFIPVSFLTTPEFQSLVASVIQWNNDRNSLTIDPAPEVSSPRVYSYPKRSRVTVDIGPHVNFRILSERKSTLTIRLYGGSAREWEKVSIDDGAIASVEVDPHTRTTDIIIVLSTGVVNNEVFIDQSPRALVVEAFKPGFEKLGIKSKSDEEKKLSVKSNSKHHPEALLSPPASPRPRSDIDAPFLALSPIKTIVIDPGHGGKDVGAVGTNGTLEKDINLQIGIALAKLLNREGRFKVILTRKDDSFVTLQERSSIANKAKADLFISLHCNAGIRRDSKGFEVYFLSEKASDDNAAAVARRENAVVELEGVTGKARQELEGLLWSLARNEHMNESSSIAGHINQEVMKRLSMTDRGVKQAGFYVLRGTSMPAILVESAFITHPKEEGLLRSDRFHQKLVDAIYAGLLDYEKKKIQSRLSKTSSEKL